VEGMCIFTAFYRHTKKWKWMDIYLCDKKNCHARIDALFLPVYFILLASFEPCHFILLTPDNNDDLI
jgi:hypothetical protein